MRGGGGVVAVRGGRCVVGGGWAALGLQVLLLEVTVSDLVTKESEGPREYATSMLRPCAPEVYLKASAVFVGFGSDAELRMVPPRPRAKLSSWTWTTAAESRSVSEASPRASKVARRIELFSDLPALLVRGGSDIARSGRLGGEQNWRTNPLSKKKPYLFCHQGGCKLVNW